ncbi:hypothetical protein KR51_00012390 [Rubidibacter lacunae KORDI 51-2]|uniref:Uncharacterized protein n=1 Tax=Rubidibacter lacunae KORDI 51-2 TaxID=582515 RepID=U5DR39_9CHRO|nr:hypothetical protein KR51_00012390 [Rubidibacter lacunae KORDI 51-2]
MLHGVGLGGAASRVVLLENSPVESNYRNSQ